MTFFYSLAWAHWPLHTSGWTASLFISIILGVKVALYSVAIFPDRIWLSKTLGNVVFGLSFWMCHRLLIGFVRLPDNFVTHRTIRVTKEKLQFDLDFGIRGTVKRGEVKRVDWRGTLEAPRSIKIVFKANVLIGENNNLSSISFLSLSHKRLLPSAAILLKHVNRFITINNTEYD